MADAHIPNINLQDANTRRELVMPAVIVVRLKPRTPAHNIFFLFHFLEAFPMKMLEVAYATENMTEATIA